MTDLQLRSIVSPRLLNALLGALGRVGRWQDALAWCEAEWWEPSSASLHSRHSCQHLLTGWSGDAQDQHSVPHLKFMKHPVKIGHQLGIPRTYNATANACIKAGKWEYALCMVGLIQDPNAVLWQN